MESDIRPDTSTNIQVQIGGNLPPGYIALILYNCPITMFEDDAPHPALKLTARQAMEVAMNIIHFAKAAENAAAQSSLIADSEAERCTELTRAGQCILRRGHGSNHAVEG